MLFSSDIPEVNVLIDNIILANHKKIGATEYNLNNTTIRKFEIKEETVEVGMFKETQKQIYLEDINGEKDPIIIANDLNEFKVIGVKYKKS